MAARLKRVYEDPSAEDGYRVLVDRLWPRGVSKERAEIDEWLKDVAPTPDLRTWFGHKPERFAQFSERYAAELDGSPALEHLRELVKEHDTVTLVIAAKDPEHNHGLVLLDQL